MSNRNFDAVLRLICSCFCPIAIGCCAGCSYRSDRRGWYRTGRALTELSSSLHILQAIFAIPGYNIHQHFFRVAAQHQPLNLSCHLNLSEAWCCSSIAAFVVFESGQQTATVLNVLSLHKFKSLINSLVTVPRFESTQHDRTYAFNVASC